MTTDPTPHPSVDALAKMQMRATMALVVAVLAVGAAAYSVIDGRTRESRATKARARFTEDGLVVSDSAGVERARLQVNDKGTLLTLSPPSGVGALVVAFDDAGPRVTLLSGNPAQPRASLVVERGRAELQLVSGSNEATLKATPGVVAGAGLDLQGPTAEGAVQWLKASVNSSGPRVELTAWDVAQTAEGLYEARLEIPQASHAGPSLRLEKGSDTAALRAWGAYPSLDLTAKSHLFWSSGAPSEAK